MPDANVRIPADARDRLAEVAAAEGLSLRAYLARLAESVLTPAERAEQARQVLHEWNGSAPTAAEQRDLDAELDRRLGADRRFAVGADAKLTRPVPQAPAAVPVSVPSAETEPSAQEARPARVASDGSCWGSPVAPPRTPG